MGKGGVENITGDKFRLGIGNIRGDRLDQCCQEDDLALIRMNPTVISQIVQLYKSSQGNQQNFVKHQFNYIPINLMKIHDVIKTPQHYLSQASKLSMHNWLGGQRTLATTVGRG